MGKLVVIALVLIGPCGEAVSGTSRADSNAAEATKQQRVWLWPQVAPGEDIGREPISIGQQVSAFYEGRDSAGVEPRKGSTPARRWSVSQRSAGRSQGAAIYRISVRPSIGGAPLPSYIGEWTV